MVWLGMALAAVGFALVVPRGARPSGGAPRHYMARGHVITTSGYDEPVALDAWKLRVAGGVMLVIGLGVAILTA